MRPAPIWSSSAAIRCSATTGALMSAPRSKRDEASVFRPSRLLVRRTDAGLKYALSNATILVAADTSASRAAHDAGDRLRAVAVGDHEHLGVELAFDAVERRDASRPACARRTRISGPASFSRSNACIGWPSSMST